MIRVCVVCEGQTEQRFIQDVLAPALHGAGLDLFTQRVQTSRGHFGGGLSYPRVKLHLRNELRRASAQVVTTLFDLYKLDTGFPGYVQSLGQADLRRRVDTLCRAFHEDIVKEAGCAAERFLPHIQPHEFEALLFSDVTALTEVNAAWATAQPALLAARQSVSSPEHINDKPETKPSARLASALNHPRFSKTLHGPAVAQRIGLARIEAECPVFASWFSQLRRLSPA